MTPRWIRKLILRHRTRQLATDLTRQVEVMRRLADSAQAHGENALLALAKFNLWILLFHRDFQSLYTDALLESDNAKRNFLVRQLAICLVDFFDRIHSLAGTGIRPTIQGASLPQSIKDELDAVLGGLGQLKNQHLEYLTELRKRAAAHRDLNSLEQLEWIEGVDVNELLAIAQEVSNAQATLVAAWILATRTYLERF
jgi:hypothetical protein